MDNQKWYENPKLKSIGLVLALAFGLIVLSWAMTEEENGPPGEAPPGKVWSSEHGHWHDA